MTTVALCGNQNSGKSTLFNLLTGEGQRVGNWPGVTVEAHAGTLLPRFSREKDVRVVDLPGIYALTPYTPEERLTRDYIVRERPDVVVNVLDALTLSRGLYLTLQLCALGRPMVLAVNMIDALRRAGGQCRLEILANALQTPVAGLCARSGEGVEDLLRAVRSQLRNPHSPAAPFPLDAAPDGHAALAAARYRWIDALTRRALTLPPAPPPALADRLLERPLFAYPLLLLTFLLVLLTAFGAPGQWLGARLDDLLQAGIAQADALLLRAGTAPLLRGLLVDGALRGVAAVLAFLPPILLLFLLLGILEDTGFMARAAFLLDRPLRCLGLDGRCFLPLMTAFGCTVPAVLSLRTLRSAQTRRRAALLLPLLPCGAKAPVYLFLTAVYWPRAGIALPLALYALGVLALILYALLLRAAPAPDAPFLLELPPWRRPTVRGLERVLRDKARDFLSRAFTIVFLSSLVLWLLQSFTPRFAPAASVSESLLTALGAFLAPLLRPLGFGTAQAAAALAAGLFAKENIISALTLTGAVFSPAGALSFAVFTALYAPCAAAQAVLRRELGGRLAPALLAQTAFAWLCAFLFYRLCLLF